MTSRKYTPPLRVRPEPGTRKEIVDRIAELQAQRSGCEKLIQGWLDIEIKRLQDKLEALK